MVQALKSRIDELKINQNDANEAKEVVSSEEKKNTPPPNEQKDIKVNPNEKSNLLNIREKDEVLTQTSQKSKSFNFS